MIDLNQNLELIKLTDVIEELEKKMSEEEVAEELTNVLIGKPLLVYWKVMDGTAEWLDVMDDSVGAHFKVKCIEYDDPGYSVEFIDTDYWYPVESLVVGKSLVKNSDVAHLWASKSNETKTLADLLSLPGLESNNGAKLYDVTSTEMSHALKLLIGAHVKIARGTSNVGWVSQMDKTVGQFGEVTGLDHSLRLVRLRVGKWYYCLDSICLSLDIVKRLNIKLTAQIIGMLGLSSEHSDELRKAVSKIDVAKARLNGCIGRIIEVELLGRFSKKVYATPTDIRDYLEKGHVFHPVYNKETMMDVVVEPVAVSFDGKWIIGKDGVCYTKLLVFKKGLK